MATDSIDALVERVEICDKALANLDATDARDREWVEPTLRAVRADAEERLRFLGHPVDDAEADRSSLTPSR